MNKEEAIKKWVDDMGAIPQSWVGCVLEHIDNDYRTLPMWGTMFIVSEFDGEKLLNNSRVMVYEKEDIDLDDIESKEGKQAREEVEKAIEGDNFLLLEDYIDEEISGERCILDKNGKPTAAYIYEVDGSYVVGINGAGWNFYDGVWDRLYDVAELHWHKEE